MRCQLRLLILVCASASPLAALADGLTVYNIQGALQSGGSASGTISLYAPTGGPIDIHITVDEGGTSYLFSGGALRGGASATVISEQFIEGPGGVNFNYLTLNFPQRSLVGYEGGPLCSLTVLCADFGASSLELTGGLYPEDPKFHPTIDSFTTLNVTAPSVPEPGTLGLAGTGLLLAGNWVRRRLQG